MVKNFIKVALAFLGTFKRLFHYFVNDLKTEKN